MMEFRQNHELNYSKIRDFCKYLLTAIQIIDIYISFLRNSAH